KASSITLQVKLELGHKAQLRKKVTSEGFTHDWMVFVQGPETGDIQHFVEKVVFCLHESFPIPKRGETDRSPTHPHSDLLGLMLLFIYVRVTIRPPHTALSPFTDFVQWPLAVLQRKIPLRPRKDFNHRPPL
uniref:YEATS domain-containing protein n=1 Tax=Sander lucioperca TaxID=283035 RepID=A0A8D0D131_SANLU